MNEIEIRNKQKITKVVLFGLTAVLLGLGITLLSLSGGSHISSSTGSSSGANPNSDSLFIWGLVVLSIGSIVGIFAIVSLFTCYTRCFQIDNYDIKLCAKLIGFEVFVNGVHYGSAWLSRLVHYQEIELNDGNKLLILRDVIGIDVRVYGPNEKHPCIR